MKKKRIIIAGIIVLVAAIAILIGMRFLAVGVWELIMTRKRK